MLVGIISDTHDDVTRTDKAVSIFKEKKVDIVLHLGDWVAPFIVRRFRGLRVIGLLGNNDGDALALRRVLEQEIGGELKGEFGDLELDGKRLAMTHGQYPALVEALARSQLYDVVLCGHTHETADHAEGRSQVLNGGVEHIIIYDTQTGEAEFVQVEATSSGLLRAKYNV